MAVRSETLTAWSDAPADARRGAGRYEAHVDRIRAPWPEMREM